MIDTCREINLSEDMVNLLLTTCFVIVGLFIHPKVSDCMYVFCSWSKLSQGKVN